MRQRIGVNNQEDCYGRQVAPKCSSINNSSRISQPIEWESFNNTFSNLLAMKFQYQMRVIMNSFKLFRSKSSEFYEMIEQEAQHLSL